MVYSPIDDAARIVARAREDTPDEFDSIVAETRDFTPGQARERLDQLGSYSRLSGRQRVEAALLSTHVQAADRAHAMYAAGTLGSVADGGGVGMPANRPPAGHGGWQTAGGDPRAQGWRAGAMRAIEACVRDGALNAPGADRVDKVLRGGDPRAQTARYLNAVGDPEYMTAFCKLLRDPLHGHLKYSAGEVEAVQAADQARIFAAALETSSTGFPLPLTVDPSIILEGDGALNPVRALADVRTIGTHDLQSVSSDGVTAEYANEGTEVSDASPSLLGPKIATEQGRAFVQYTIEAGQDDPTLAGELARLIRDAREVLDASVFLTGTGSDQPSGILNIGGLNGLTTTERVQTATAATFVPGDSWALKAAIPARFINKTTFAAAPATWDTAFRQVAQADATEPRQFANGDRGADFLGRPKVEWSTMDTATATTGKKIIVAGDFATGYRIVDRLGAQAELIPHMFGTAGNLPTGTRGLYVYWRTGAGVVALNALRYLEVK